MRQIAPIIAKIGTILANMPIITIAAIVQTGTILANVPGSNCANWHNCC
jgi:hypothetical protein